MNALVLSGGSIKGSYQAGVIAELLLAGFEPDIITGISVGALNTAYLVAFLMASWAEAGAGLADFWLREVTDPSKFMTKRHIVEVAFRVLVLKQWAGLVDTDPLKQVLDRTFVGKFPMQSPVQARVGAVNLRTGQLEYHGPESPYFLDAVMASTAEPVAMPTRKIGKDVYVDGGLREINPLAEAIRLGATRIVCVICQPEKSPESGANWDDVMALLGRCTSLVSNEIVNNDLRFCEMINEAVLTGEMPGKRIIEVDVIRPPRNLKIDALTFTADDIRRMVMEGRADARTQMPAFLQVA